MRRIALLGLLLLSASRAHAQPPVEADAEVAPSRALTVMTPEQRTLYSQGETAARNEDWETAARYFRAAVSLGGFNLGWLSLGEALARLGQCTEAATALDAVGRAPAVPEAPTRFADAMAHAQRQALGRTCPGRLVVTCAAPLLHFRLPDGAERPCGEPLDLPAGRYALRAGSPEAPLTLDAWVVGVETTRVHLVLPTAPEMPPIVMPPPATPERGPLTLTGALIGGVGAVALVGAGVLHAATLDARIAAESDADAYGRGEVDRATADASRDRFANLRRWTIAGYVGGAALAAAGVTLIVLDAPEADSSSHLALGAGSLTFTAGF